MVIDVNQTYCGNHLQTYTISNYIVVIYTNINLLCYTPDLITNIVLYVNYTQTKKMLCDHLEGWDRERGREGGARGKRYGNICICITDSLCYKAETNTPQKNNYTPIKTLKKNKVITKKKKEFTDYIFFQEFYGYRSYI